MYRAIDRKKLRSQRKLRFWRKRRMCLSKPRLCVFRSSRHVQAQLIDDVEQKVLAVASSLEKDVRGASLKGLELAAKVGELVAQRAVSAGIKEIVFDKNGYSYHGRVKALADAARNAGLKF